MNVSDRLVYGIFSIIEFFLVFRILFLLFGANANNPIAKFIYGTSYPLVAPFSGLFPNIQFGRFVLASNSVTALIFYTIAGIVLVEILTSFVQRQKDRRNPTV